jgi:type II secretory pathway component PulM
MPKRPSLKLYWEDARRQAAAWLEQPIRMVAAAVRPWWEASRTWYQGREQREKLLLKVLGAIIAVLFVYNVIYRPIIGYGIALQERVAARQHQLVEVRAMMRRWERMQMQLASAEKRTVSGNKDFSLFSVVEQTLTRSVGRDKIGSITPSDKPVAGGFVRHAVDLKLNGVNLRQIVDALYGVQTLGVPITVSNLHIHQRSQDPHTYDVDLTCAALGRNG